MTNVQLLGHTAVTVYRTQQNPDVDEILIIVNLKQGNKRQRKKDGVLHVCHVSPEC